MRARESQDIQESHLKVDKAVLVKEKIFSPRDFHIYVSIYHKNEQKYNLLAILCRGLKKKKIAGEPTMKRKICRYEEVKDGFIPMTHATYTRHNETERKKKIRLK